MKWYYNNRFRTVPNKLVLGDRVVYSPKEQHLLQAGWKLAPQEISDIDPKFIKWVHGDPFEMNTDEKQAVLQEEFEKTKGAHVQEINARTDAILSEGFTFDNSIFSLSVVAQGCFTGLLSAIESGLLGEGDFPYELTTLDDKSYSLAWDKKDLFFAAVLSNISDRLAAGRVLTTAIRNAATQAELDAIVDER